MGLIRPLLTKGRTRFRFLGPRIEGCADRSQEKLNLPIIPARSLPLSSSSENKNYNGGGNDNHGHLWDETRGDARRVRIQSDSVGTYRARRRALCGELG